MAVKKSDLYSSLWASCDQLRGNMDATQYKDYVLFMLFIKYISDKYANSDAFAPPIVIPPGASFQDLGALKGKPDIGDKINTQIIQPLLDANPKLGRNDFPNFNDPEKLGEGQDMVERLTTLISIFEDPRLNFSKNRAEHDDILGDAYEFLMRHFATESGKSKGQFYTPSEVSRVMAQVLGISPENTVAATTAYDPTCGSGSLLLKVAAAAGRHITLEGQEKDMTTSGLARMNMILHDFPTANIATGNTLAAPKFKDGERLRTYDYVVANPPFSDKAWSTGMVPEMDEFERFSWGVPPKKQGDYAYLLHIIRSMKSTGKGACILPHGVLFRGNAEEVIRRNLVRSGYLKAIIGLPANLFYGTGIPACILVLDKDNAQARRGVFMIDASRGFKKDGPKNRLREQDIHRIVDTFRKQEDVPRYARMVPFEEIASEKNGYNLNLPRYVDTTEPEDLQDIDGHLRGGIPIWDLDGDEERRVPGLQRYWEIMPGLRSDLFRACSRPGYCDLTVEIPSLKTAIFDHPEFSAFVAAVTEKFELWKAANLPVLKGFAQNNRPKDLIHQISEDLLATFKGAPLMDAYDVYQHLMDYWAETMQDDAYLIAADGWKVGAQPREIVKVKDKNNKLSYPEPHDYQVAGRRYKSDLVPANLLVACYFGAEVEAIDQVEARLANADQRLDELRDDHGDEQGLLSDVFSGETDEERDKKTQALVKARKAKAKARRKEIGKDPEYADEAELLLEYESLIEEADRLKGELKLLRESLDAKIHGKYAVLTEEEIKTLVVDDKWLATLAASVQGELDRVSQTLTGRIRQLAERYATPLPQLTDEVAALAAKVDQHLQKMGVVWK